MADETSLKKIHPELLGFDFDGVLADTAEAFLRLACEEYGECGFRLEDITSFEVEGCLSMAPARISAVFNRILHDSVGVGLRPMPGVVEALVDLSLRARVTVITARPEPEPVRRWLAEHLPARVCRRIQLIAMGAHDDKARHIRAAGLLHFIDDRAETCLQLAREGLAPIVFHQPWNRGRHQLPEVGSWHEIRALWQE
ncbi:MAG: hypothetical protein BWK76_14945 [Desulfobulbaceae bacterium A2]|nr:MAG: hypothetical protein BWK76_14945 [Desulfobulbaceae bacterium A2]